MPTILDTLITRFTLDDKYSTGAKNISQTTATLTDHVGKATQKMGGMTQGLTQLAGVVPGLNMVATAILQIGDASLAAAADMAVAEDMVDPLMAIAQVLLAIAAGAVAAEAGLFAFSGESYRVYMRMDTLRRSFTGFLGDVKQSDQMMKFLEQYSVGKPFKLTELGDAAVQLSQLQLSVNKYLPTLTTLATVFKRPEESYGRSLENMAEIVRRVQGGEVALGLGPRGIGRFVSKKILEQIGVGMFDAKGEFIGNIDQAMGLLTALAQKEQKVADAIKGGAEAMAADFDDAKEKLMDSFAQGFAPLVQKVGASITGALTEVTDAGVMKDFGEELARIFDFDPSETNLSNGIVEVEGLFIQISVAMKNTAKIGWNMLEVMWAVPKAMFWMGQAIQDTLNPFGWKNIKRDIQGAGDAMTGSHTRRASPDDFMDAFLGASDRQQFVDAEMAKLEAHRARKKKGNAKAPESAATAEATAIATQTDLLRQIAFFTGQTAKALERHLFGGGDLARQGVSPAEMGSGAGSKYSHHVVGAAMNLVDAMMAEAIPNHMSAYARAGMVNTSR